MAPGRRSRRAISEQVFCQPIIRAWCMMLLFLATVLEQLDLALEHVAKGDIRQRLLAPAPRCQKSGRNTAPTPRCPRPDAVPDSGVPAGAGARGPHCGALENRSRIQRG